MHKAESAVGLEMERVGASEVAAAEGMEAQMVSLLSVHRTTQSKAESRSMTALEQHKISGDLDAYATRLTHKGG